MLPLNIIILLYIFITIYFVGIGFSIYMLINSIKDKKRLMVLISLVFIIFYVLFGLALI